VVADACSGLGELSQAAAEKTASNQAERRHHWLEARNWYQQAILAWQHVPNPGVITLAEFRAKEPKQATRLLAICNAQLESLMTPDER
jgi:hypothetical protein